LTEFKDKDGNTLVWVFHAPGRVWKERWVAFTNSSEFIYHKGDRDSAFKWAEDYIRSML
jgi:hypothetical protein